MRETAYAKVNLALHVRAREADGYHRLETIFAFAEDGDTLEAGEPSAPGAIELDVTGPFAKALSPGGRGLGEGDLTSRIFSDIEPPHPGALPTGERENLVVLAAKALRNSYGLSAGVRLRLDKRLPVASGIGGGSADAAAALRLLTRWWSLPDEPALLHDIARGLGADVPACLISRTARGEGRGDELELVDGSGMSGTPILLVNPLVPVSTAAVFARWDGVDRGPLGAGLLGRNDLEAPARAIAPVIGDALEALAGARFASMSGSGATCFALYDEAPQRDAAQARISRDHPAWWTLISRLR